MRTSTRMTVALALTLVLAAPVLAQEEDAQGYLDDYSTGDFGRIRYVENGVTLSHSEQAAEPARTEEQGTINTPVFPGDKLRTGVDQRVEVQLAGGTNVRVDRATEMSFLALPDPYAEYRDNTLLQVALGTVRLDARVGSSEEFRLDTPAASVYLLSDGDFRIEVWDNGTTRVTSRRGVAEVAGHGGSVLVRGGMSTDVDRGGVPETPREFYTFNKDAFDRWCDERGNAYRVRDRYIASGGAEAYEEMPYEVRPYYGELSAYGRWVSVPTYGWVWYPYDVAPGWRPYYDGYWDYGPGGYFWVSYEPWGWAPYHYGRWTWAVGYGWCWIPGRIFGGAWVSWSWGTGYVGWAPLDYWNRPAYVSMIRYGYYDPYAWTFIGYEHINRRHYRRYVVSADRLGGRLRDRAVVTRPPRVPPGKLARDPAARSRAVREAASYRGARVRPASRTRPREASFDSIEHRWAAKSGREGDSRWATRWAQNDGRRDDGTSRSRRSSARPRPPENRRAVPRPVDGGRKGRVPVGRSRSGADSSRLSTPPPRGDRRPSTTAPNERRTSRAPTTGARSPMPPRRGTPAAGADRGRDRRAPEAQSRSSRRPDTTRQRVAPRRAAPRSTGARSRGASDRVREMYRKLARPRTTPEARTHRPTEPRRSTGPRTRTETRRVTPRRSAPPHQRQRVAPRRSAPPQRRASPPPRRTAPRSQVRPRTSPRPSRAPSARPSSRSRGRAENPQRRSNGRRRK